MTKRAAELLRRYRWGLLLLLLVGAHAVNHWQWLARHADPTLGEVKGWDTRWHLRNCAVYHGLMREALESGRGAGAGLATMLAALRLDYRPHLLNHLWPRLMYLTALPAALLFGASGRVYEMNNILWLGLLLVCVYAIGKRCAGPPAGLLAAFLTSIFPGVFGVARRFELDLPLTAMVALTMLCLIRTDGFRRPRASALLGLVAGVGLLVKPQLALFLLPALYALLASLRQPEAGRPVDDGIAGPERQRKRLLLHAAIAAAIALAVSALWWRGGLDYLNPAKLPLSAAVASGSGPLHYLRHGLFYLIAAAESCGPLVFLLSLPGIVLGLRDERIAHRVLLAVWLLGAYALLTLPGHKLQRFFFPALPAIALLAAVGLVAAWRGATRTRRVVGRVLVVCIVVQGAVQLASVSWSRWGMSYIWGWAGGPHRALAGPTFDKRIRSNHRLWDRSSAEERAYERGVLELVDDLLARVAADRGAAGSRRVRIGAVGKTFLTHLEAPLALRTHDGFSFLLLTWRRGVLDGPPAGVPGKGPPNWIVQFGAEVDAREVEEAPRTDYVLASHESPVTEELERSTRARLAAEEGDCAPCAERRRAQIQYVRRCFSRVVSRRPLRLPEGVPAETVYLLRNTCASAARRHSL
jgi:hypothetical protein